MKTIALVLLMSTLFTGCASVKMQSTEASDKAKQFAEPAAGNSGLYIFRDQGFGMALKRDIWVNGKCVGASAYHVFFYTEVTGGREHELSTESEFSPNKISLMVEAGKNYFIRQYLRFGVFRRGANLEAVPEDQGKAIVATLDLATSGTCSQ